MFLRDEELLFRAKRAGVIPYTNINGKLFFLVAKDRRYNQYTDFGGSAKHCFETAKENAFREFHEETNDIFSHFLYFKSVAVADFLPQRSVIVFVFIPFEIFIN